MRFWRDVGEAMTEAFQRQSLSDDLRVIYYWYRDTGTDPTFWVNYR